VYLITCGTVLSACLHMQRYQGRIQGLTSHPSLRQKKTYYKEYYISGYTASQ